MKEPEVQFRNTSIKPLTSPKKGKRFEGAVNNRAAARPKCRSQENAPEEKALAMIRIEGKTESPSPWMKYEDKVDGTEFRERRGKGKRRAIAILLSMVLTVGGIRLLPEFAAVMPEAALISAGIMMPEGGAKLLQGNGGGWQTSSKDSLPAGNDQVQSGTSVSSQEDGSSQAAASSGSGSSSPDTSSFPSASSAVLPENMLPVKEISIVSTGNYKSKNGLVQVINKSQVHKFDVDEEMAKKPDVKITSTKEPQVLIYHTHTTEAYLEKFTGSYVKGTETRSEDPKKSVVNVGNIIADKLNAAGITTIHDTTINDSPAYNGAYTRSLNKAEAYLKQHPSIQVILDVHRDSLTQENGTKLKPTAEINGKKAAQIMIVSGCDDYGKLGYPDWEYNLRFGLQLQNRLATTYAGLVRPLYFWNIRYNQHLTHGTLLVEFGTEVNTYDEVAYSAELFANALISELNQLKS